MYKIFFCLNFFLISGCTTLSPRQKMQAYLEANSKAHHAAYAADGAFLDKDQPERAPTRWEFYFKQCVLDERRPYVGRGEYMCSDPY